jgi:hypothetical protein
MVMLLALLAATALLTGGVCASPPAAVVSHSGAEWTLSNGFVRATLSTKRLLHPAPAISSLKGDFEGHGNYGEELLAGAGYHLESVAPDGSILSTSSDATVKVLSNGPSTAAILVSGVSAGGATEEWTLSLAADSRSLSLNITGTMSSSVAAAAASAAPTRLVRHVLSATPRSVYGFYPQDGVVQVYLVPPPCTLPCTAYNCARGGGWGGGGLF